MRADAVKQAAQGRWPEILSALGGIEPGLLDGKHHPCPKCGGRDRFRLIDPEAGALYCNQCFHEGNGDGLAALQWLCGWSFSESLEQVAQYLGLPTDGPKRSNGRSAGTDWLAKARRFFERPAAREKRAELAEVLGVDEEPVEQLRVGWDGQRWTWPERDHTGHIIGIGTRNPEGDKRFMPGGRRGLIYTHGWSAGEGPILLVEGLSDTAAAMSVGLAAIGRPSATGGVDLLASLLKDTPAQRPIIVLGENDQKPDGTWPGRDGAERTAGNLAEKLRRPIGWALPPDGAKDLRAWLQAHGQHGRRFLERLDVSIVRPDLPPPLPVWQPFPTDVFPAPARRLIEAAARSVRVDPAMVAVPCLVSMAAAIGGARVVRIKEGWSEPSIIWAAVVARSGEQKSPPLEIATEPLAEAEQRLAAKDPDQRVVARDITIESLSSKLKDSPRGLVLVRDELAGWFDGFRRYRSHGSDAPAWIECFHGRRLVVDRVQRGTVRIRRAVVSVVGTIQPGIFRNYAGPALVESGLIPRLLLVMPPRRPRRWSDAELPQSVTAGWAELIGRLFDLPMPVDDFGDPAPAVSDLAPEARELFREWVNGLGAEVDRADDTLAAMLSKLEGYVARLALVLHLARWAACEQVDAARIDHESMSRAVRLGWWFRNELERVAGLLLGDPADAERLELVDWIRQRGGVVTPRDLQVGCWRFRKPGAAEQALDNLARNGWGTWETIKPGGKGRPRRQFRLSEHQQHQHQQKCENPRENGNCVDVDVVGAEV